MQPRQQCRTLHADPPAVFQFRYATSFNQPLGSWVVGSSANATSMLYQATAFELPANAPWYDWQWEEEGEDDEDADEDEDEE